MNQYNFDSKAVHFFPSISFCKDPALLSINTLGKNKPGVKQKEHDICIQTRAFCCQLVYRFFQYAQQQYLNALKEKTNHKQNTSKKDAQVFI